MGNNKLNLSRRILRFRKIREIVSEQFNSIYYNSLVWANGETRWLGTPVQKSPTDLWIYQEMIFEEKPDLIIETGTASGGSASFFASLFDLIGKGEIITVDVEDLKGRPRNNRITYLHGSSTSKEIVEQIRRFAINKEKVMVILDSDHRKIHVLNELKIYWEFVTKKSYLVVEDTNINGHPVLPDFGGGPMEAVEDFLKENKSFVVDRSKEKFYLTFNPKGYLRRTN